MKANINNSPPPTHIRKGQRKLFFAGWVAESYHEDLKERLETMVQNENADGRSTQNDEY